MKLEERGKLEEMGKNSENKKKPNDIESNKKKQKRKKIGRN